MLSHYSVFNFTLIEKVTQAIKTKRSIMNVEKNIQIKTKNKPNYNNTIDFDNEDLLLSQMDIYINDALIRTQMITKTVQETIPLSSKAQEFLQEIDQIISQEYSLSNKNTQQTKDTHLLKKAFNNLAQVGHTHIKN